MARISLRHFVDAPRATGRPDSQLDNGSPPPPTLDSLLPAEMAVRAEQIGVRKSLAPAATTFALAVLAGAFIALGGVFATTISVGSGALPWGVARGLSGLAFSLGLILVIVGGAELFTGNNLIVMAWAGGRVSTKQVLRNWSIVYAGNLVGAVGIAVLVWLSGQHTFADGAVGSAMLQTADAKCRLGFGQAVCLGVLCNVLVCLAVWLTFSARTTTDRILAIVPPIAAFVAAGFEHSVANMYFIPLGLLLKWSGTDGAPVSSDLSVGSFLAGNLLPVTIGNIIGGAVLVGAVYWFVYLRHRTSTDSTADTPRGPAA